MKQYLKLIFLIIYFISINETGKSQIQTGINIIKSTELADFKDYTGIVLDHYANGIPKLWKELSKGKANGQWLEWYPDGTLRYKAFWKNDLGHGKWEYFHPNGKLRSESFYIADIEQGISRSYYENGQLHTDGIYLNGKKTGIELIYDTNGVINNRQMYHEGEIVIDQPRLFELGNITDLKSNGWGICFTPDGKTAYFTRRDAITNEKRIYESTKNATGWSNAKIASFSIAEDEGPFINQQGTKLYFASYRPLPDGSTIEKYDSNIWYMDKTNNGWSTPKPVSNNINQSAKAGNKWPNKYEASPSTDSVGNLYFFTKSSQTNATNIYVANLQSNQQFGNPKELIEPSNDQYFDSAPVLSPDGKILFFASDNRPEGLSGSDIYYSKKINGEWSKPKNLSPFLVNSYYDESSPSFSPDGKYFFFSSTRAGLKDAKGELIWHLYYIESKFLGIE